METYLNALAKMVNVELDNEKISQLIVYKELLLEWNKKINLTAITADEEIALKHFIDSLTLEKYILPNSTVIDVGTGAGFPGMVLGIVRKDCKITLLDSLNKRIQFLNEVINHNLLNNIDAIHGRAEDYGVNKEYREKYDIAVARAVASLEILSEYCLPFVKLGGYFIAMKGSNVDEIERSKRAIFVLGGQIEKIEHFNLPESDIERNIILIKKVKSTPIAYPRKAGTPEKKPIV